MRKNFELLRKEFEKIKQKGAIKSLRKGSTGIGYTFETLLNKKEDKESKPDFLGIELKTKLGYSKSPLTLFHCAPLRNKEYATNYLFNKYANKKLNNENVSILEREVYCEKFYKNYNYGFKLSVDYYKKQISMKSYYKGKFLEYVCYWDFDQLENILKEKLSYLAIINGYPYTYDNELYYKFFTMKSYELKDFSQFLRLIEEDKIFISIYITKNNNDSNAKIDNHGYAFRIKNEFIEELFSKLPY